MEQQSGGGEPVVVPEISMAKCEKKRDGNDSNPVRGAMSNGPAREEQGGITSSFNRNSLRSEDRASSVGSKGFVYSCIF